MFTNECLSKDLLVTELQAAGATVKGTVVKCPFHDDRTPSGQIYQSEDGHFRYKCHTATCGFCGDVFDIRAKLNGQPLAAVLRGNNRQKYQAVEKASPPPKVYKTVDEIKATIRDTIEDTYPYTNPTTNKPDLIVLRLNRDGKKSFLQISPNGDGFVLKAPPKPWPLFNRIKVQGANRVIVVEGEKCVKALRSARFVGTTNPAGAGKAEHADWTPLAGKKVYIWSDNNEVGIEHGRQVSSILEKLQPTPTLFWIEPSKYQLPEGGDVVDFLRNLNPETHNTAILSVLENAQPVNPAQEVDAWYEDVIAGKIKAINWPWNLIGGFTQALLPKKVTLLCGAPGASKSLFLLQCLAHWYQENIKVAVFELEIDVGFHLRRALAQREENSNLCDAEWISENKEEVRRIKGKPDNKEFLTEFGRCIYAEPNKDVSLNYLVEWAEKRGEEGCRIIVIDPVTIASKERDVWIADLKFVLSLRTIAAKYNTSIILVTHPKKTMGGQKTNTSLDALSGGSAYQRFTDTILWLQSYPDSKEFKIATAVGTSNFSVNRVIRILKANNGKGTGVGVAYKFYPESLKLGEQGIIVPEGKRKD